MKILIVTGCIYPLPSNNANIIMKLIPSLVKEHEVQILAGTSEPNGNNPEEMYGVPVNWIKQRLSLFERKVAVPALTKIYDRKGFSDISASINLRANLKQVYERFAYDAVLVTMEPYSNGVVLKYIPPEIKKIVYMMDPPAPVIKEFRGSPFRTRSLPAILGAADMILTTNAIADALAINNYIVAPEKIRVVGFPMIQQHNFKKTSGDIIMDPKKINLLYCGWLYSKMRSPKCFLDIVSDLGSEFAVYFMGKECEKLFERFNVSTDAEVICLPQQDYSVALNAMNSADILINIGNSVSIHTPSKLLEYINLGKPIVNFVKIDDCPSRYFTNRYPACLEIKEKEYSAESIKEFVDFCRKGKTNGRVDRDYITEHFKDCTTEYIVDVINAFLKV